MKKVLVVDDEPTLVATLKYNLEREGYHVITAGDGESGLSAARDKRPDLIVLDLLLPVMDGLEVCRVLRREMTTPILMLTAKTEEIDKVVGLELGADDYVTKPFGMRELLARVRALLRRAESVPPAEVDVLLAGDLQVDLRRMEASKDGRTLALKPKELDLLAFFLRNRGRAFTRDQILNQVWGYERTPTTRTVDTHVVQLRTKLRADLIESVRGIGYRLRRET